MQKQSILKKIKETVHGVEPGATVILYGSYARGDENKDSDIDLLILLEKEVITYSDRKRITYPLYDLSYQYDIIISPALYSKNIWQTKHVITPFYENVQKEGVEL